ncbi:MAG: sigma-54 dependent transcriptional regulator [Deltaproteobacteria bacterium]
MKSPAYQASILVVEDDLMLAGILEAQLEQAGYRVFRATGGHDALEVLSHTPIDVTLTDVKMPGMSGLELLREIRRRDADADLVAITAHSSVKDAVEAIRTGAADYLEKPVDPRRLQHTLQMLTERRQLRRRVHILELGGAESNLFHGMVARSRSMLEVFTVIERLAQYPTTALITGESGTGKELVARALHACSPLADRPFVVCNCSALPTGLIESELFGHKRGSFTGADRDHMGLFEAADGGTIFLDEIGELPLDAQVKLLRVLENREIRRVGAAQSKSIDIRIIAATNRDLARMSAEGGFREDLYYRLNVGTVQLPPLRERLEDIPLLSDHILATTTRRLGIETGGISAKALACIQAYEWPGNVRQLANALERSLIMACGEAIREEHLPSELRRPEPAPAMALATAPLGELSLQGAERDQIRRALNRAGGKRVAAARLLGLSRRTLYRKLDKYGIR